MFGHSIILVVGLDTEYGTVPAGTEHRILDQDCYGVEIPHPYIAGNRLALGHTDYISVKNGGI